MMNIRIILILLVALGAAAGGAGGIEIRGDYAGDGTFSIRDHVGGQQVAASGANASMAFGHILGEGQTFAGLDMDGEGGRFKVVGLVGLAHLAQAFDMTNISARATVGGDSTLYTIAGTGQFRERIIGAGKNGRPDTLVEAEFLGKFDINTSAKADPSGPDLLIMEV